MRVRIRFGRGSVVTRRKGKNARVALLIASLLTLIAICLAFMGFWRLLEDVDLTGDFVFDSGILSHWQIWLGGACAIQYAAWRLTAYSRGAGIEGAPEEGAANNPAALPL